MTAADLQAATAANAYHGFCVESSEHPGGCDFYNILELLAGSDAWVQIGRSGQVDEIRLTLLFDRFTSDLVQNYLPQGDSLESLATWTGTLPNGQSATVTPIAWGNYYFGTDGYSQFVNGNDSRLAYCERIQGYDRSTNPPTPYEYLFVITNIATGNPQTNYIDDQVGVPSWMVDSGTPNRRLSCGQG